MADRTLSSSAIRVSIFFVAYPHSASGVLACVHLRISVVLG